MTSPARVLVTGAAGGIGAACARAFHASGSAIAVSDSRGAPLEALTRELPGATPLEFDLSTPAAAAGLIESAWASLGGVGVLVNAAGLFPSRPLLEVDAAHWDAVHDVNVRGPLLLTIELARRLAGAGRGGSVINVSSGAAVRARAGTAAYAASKAALNMVTKSCALELAPLGIRVNAVAPGYVRVDSEVNPVPAEYDAAMARLTPLGRTGLPTDIAPIVLWLAGPDAAWITGAVIPADGGSSTGSPDAPTWTP